MSYVIDVYRGDGRVQKSLINVCLYISFFPQLIAGPIVRYQTVADEIDGPAARTLPDFALGCRARSWWASARRPILANQIWACWSTRPSSCTPASSRVVAGAWIAACAYLMQVYYDFSGYSDMAIGLGRMFGFHFLENFNRPLSGLVRHRSSGGAGTSPCPPGSGTMSISPWAGAGSKSVWRLLFNMLMVWGLAGLWHGAASRDVRILGTWASSSCQALLSA